MTACSVGVVTDAGDALAYAPLIDGEFRKSHWPGDSAYEGALEVRGLLAATRSSTELAVAAIATGLEADEEGMWHFHRGFQLRRRKPADAGRARSLPWRAVGILARRGAQPRPRAVRRRAGGNPTAPASPSSASASSLNRPDEYAAIGRAAGASLLPSFEGRAWVVHAPDGAYAACGTLDGAARVPLLAEVTPHPDAPSCGPSCWRRIDGLALLEQRPSGDLALQLAVHGLAPGETALWSLRTGFVCPAYFDKLGRLVPLDVGTPAMPEYEGTLEADGDGGASLSWETNTKFADGLRGHVLLLSDAEDKPLACGPLEPSRSLVAIVGGAIVVVAPAECGVAVRVAGAPSDAVKIEGLQDEASADLGELRGRVVTIEGLPGSATLEGSRPEAPSGAAGRCIDDAGALGAALASIGGATVLFLAAACAVLHLPVLWNLRERKRKRAASVVTPSHRADDPMVGQTSAVTSRRTRSRRSSVEVVLDVVRRQPQRFLPRAAPPPETELEVSHVKVGLASPSAGVHEQARNEWRRGYFAVRAAAQLAATTRESRADRPERSNQGVRQNVRPKLLVLHGAGANRAVARLQLTNLGLTEDDFEFVIPDGPFPEARASDPLLEAMVDGPFYSWYPKETSISRAAAEEALNAVLGAVLRFGPFDGVFGFSQGAAVAATLLQDDVLGALGQADEGGTSSPPRTASLSRRRRAASPADRAASPAASPSAGPQRHCSPSAGPHARPAEVHARPAVVAPLGRRREPLSVRHPRPRRAADRAARGTRTHGGAADGRHRHPVDSCDRRRRPLKPHSEASALLFQGGRQRVCLYHDAGHALPRELQTNALLRARLLAHVDAALVGATREIGAAPSLLAPVLGRAPSEQSVGFQHRRHALHLLEDEGGRSHVVSPWSPSRLEAAASWRPVSSAAQIWVSAEQQLVMCRAATPPGTLRALLAAQPTDAPCIREAGFAPATYGALLAFISDGGGGDLRRLGVQPADVVAYAAPGGSAVAAVAFLTIAAQAVAAPLDAALSEADAENALVQLQAAPPPRIRGRGRRRPSAAGGEGLFRRRRSASDPRGGAAERGRAGGHLQAARDATERDRGAGSQGQHTARPAGVGDVVGYDAAVGGVLEVTEGHMGWRKGPPLSNGPGDVSLLLRTSGTTSRPKGVPLSQGQLVQNAGLLAASLSLTPADVALNAMPLFHIGGLAASLLASVAAGAQVTCMRAVRARRLCRRAVRRHGVRRLADVVLGGADHARSGDRQHARRRWYIRSRSGAHASVHPERRRRPRPRRRRRDRRHLRRPCRLHLLDE